MERLACEVRGLGSALQHPVFNGGPAQSDPLVWVHEGGSGSSHDAAGLSPALTRSVAAKTRERNEVERHRLGTHGADPLAPHPAPKEPPAAKGEKGAGKGPAEP